MNAASCVRTFLDSADSRCLIEGTAYGSKTQNTEVQWLVLVPVLLIWNVHRSVLVQDTRYS